LQTSPGKFIVGGQQAITLSTSKGFFISVDENGIADFSKIIGTNANLTSIHNALMALQVCGVTGFYDAPRNLWLNVPYILSTNEQGDTLRT